MCKHIIMHMWYPTFWHFFQRKCQFAFSVRQIFLFNLHYSLCFGFFARPLLAQSKSSVASLFFELFFPFPFFPSSCFEPIQFQFTTPALLSLWALPLPFDSHHTVACVLLNSATTTTTATTTTAPSLPLTFPHTQHASTNEYIQRDSPTSLLLLLSLC